MKHRKLSILWPEGLHMRPAAALVRAAMAHKSSIQLRVGSKVADACCIFALMLLSAGFGASVDVEISGEDEDVAMESIVQVFEDVS